MTNTWVVRFADGSLTQASSANLLLQKIASQHYSYKKELSDKENILLRLHEQTGGWIDPDLPDSEFLSLLAEADFIKVTYP